MERRYDPAVCLHPARVSFVMKRLRMFHQWSKSRLRVAASNGRN
jgi:hypothetical protein